MKPQKVEKSEKEVKVVFADEKQGKENNANPNSPLSEKAANDDGGSGREAGRDNRDVEPLPPVGGFSIYREEMRCRYVRCMKSKINFETMRSAS